MRMPRDLGPRMQAAAQDLVDWYAATYGPNRARRYLGACARHGLALPPCPPASPWRWKAGLAIAALLLALGAAGALGLSTSSLVSRQSHIEVQHESR
ncbi:MAG: hypothetical protein U0166_20970 [Acidobacteriota bacterium]